MSKIDKFNPIQDGKMSGVGNTTSWQFDHWARIKLVDKHQAAAILAISPETLKKYRLQPNSTLIEGVHYFVWNARVIRYNAELLADWGMNRANPGAHQKAIEAFLASLPANQPTRKRRAG